MNVDFTVNFFENKQVFTIIHYSTSEISQQKLLELFFRIRFESTQFLEFNCLDNNCLIPRYKKRVRNKKNHKLKKSASVTKKLKNLKQI